MQQFASDVNKNTLSEVFFNRFIRFRFVFSCNFLPEYSNAVSYALSAEKMSTANHKLDFVIG